MADSSSLQQTSWKVFCSAVQSTIGICLNRKMLSPVASWSGLFRPELCTGVHIQYTSVKKPTTSRSVGFRCGVRLQDSADHWAVPCETLRYHLDGFGHVDLLAYWVPAHDVSSPPSKIQPFAPSWRDTVPACHSYVMALCSLHVIADRTKIWLLATPASSLTCFQPASVASEITCSFSSKRYSIRWIHLILKYQIRKTFGVLRPTIPALCF